MYYKCITNVYIYIKYIIVVLISSYFTFNENVQGSTGCSRADATALARAPGRAVPGQATRAFSHVIAPRRFAYENFMQKIREGEGRPRKASSDQDILKKSLKT